MKDLLRYLVENIVDETEAIQISQSDENGTQILHLKVASAETGKIIGKGGKVIKALRAALKVKAIPARKRLHLVLED
ncbi:MAG: KH domain-containing protein [bacterium]|nr:KH domain-containing protein [bacterium]